MLRRLQLLGCFLFIYLVQISAQTGELPSNKQLRVMEEEGEFYFEEKKYDKALEYFLQLESADPNNSFYKLIIGICYSYSPDQKDKSIEYLEKVKEMDDEFNEINLYLGRAYLVNNKYPEAKESLELYLSNEAGSKELAEEAKQLISNSESAQVLTADSLKEIEITNMGTIINTTDDEYVPLITPDEYQLIYTYKGEKSKGGLMNDKGEPDNNGDYHEDVYISFKSPDDWMYDEDVWLEPKPIESINTEGHDACIALSIDGQTLFMYNNSEENGGDIYFSRLDGDEWGVPIPLPGEVNTKYWEGHMTIASDEKVMYFSSDRPGGLGGRDIYKAEKLANGEWGNVTNLGPTVNTSKNEDAPYLHLDKRTLYFSSEGFNSMGGYDVFYSEIDDGGEWTDPINMGCPINTTEDDKFYVVSADGLKGYYSSSHGVSRVGGTDIFVVTPDPAKMRNAPIAALIVGTVFADDVPTGSIIRVYNATNQETSGTFRSNSKTGDYRIALIPGSKYSIDVDVENFDTHTDEIDLVGLNQYIEVSNNIHVYSDEYIEANNIAPSDSTMQDALTTAVEESKKVEVAVAPVVVPDIEKKEDEVTVFEAEEPTKVEQETENATVVVVPPIGNKDDEEPVEETVKEPVAVATTSNDPCNEEFVDMSGLIGLDLNVRKNYEKLLGLVGNYCADDLQFKVQIGAYRFPKNFKYTKWDNLGPTDVTDYPDGITRFTKGEFVTLQNAEELRQKAIAAGVKDAWVIPFFDGERIFMEDLIKVNFYNRSVN